MNDFDEIKGSLVKFKQSKYFPYVRSALRGILQYVFYAICFSLMASTFQEGFYNQTTTELLKYPAVWGTVATVLMAYFVLNSSLFTFAIFDSKERKRFLEARRKAQKEEDDEEEKRLVEEIQSSPKEFWVEFGVLVGLCFLFPVWYGYRDVTAWITFAEHLPGIVHRLIVTLIFAVASFLILLRVPYSAQQHWLKKQTDAYNKKGYVASDSINKRSYTKFRLFLRLIGLLILYSIGASLICALIPIAFNALTVWIMLLQELSVLLVIAVIAALIIGRVLWKRLKFYFRLKRYVKKCGFRILEKKHFFLSMFHTGKSYNLAIESNRKIYYCKIIASFRRRNRLQFLKDGTLKRIFGLHLPTPQVMVQSRFAMGVVYIDSSHVDEREIFTVKRESKYTFDCKEGGRKILILNPVPTRVILGADTRKNADNGDRIGDYTVYTGGAFLRALKNDAVNDRDV